MNDQGIVQYALANLQKAGKIEAKWLDNAPNEVLDDTIALTLNNRTIKLGVELNHYGLKCHRFLRTNKIHFNQTAK